MAKKKSTTKKTAKTKKAAKKTTVNAVKKTAKKAAKKTAKKSAKKAVKAVEGVKKAAKAKKEEPVVSASPVAEDDIAAIAYQIYIERIQKGIPGDAHSDWAEAEQRVHAV